jgi:porin
LTDAPAQADDTPPPVFTASLRDQLDSWWIGNGTSTGPVSLNRLQLTGTLAGDRLGLPGLSLHAQVYNFSGAGLSKRVGDIQTADAIDAVPATRLFEAWIEQRFGSEKHNIAVRMGFLDVNADFDSIANANWLVNSSQGIGADLAKSGLNGPSIYPVSALGVRVSWTPDDHWTVRAAVLDGVPGDPDRPRLFVSARLAPSDGVFTIGQVDYRWSDKARVALGAWRYSHARPTIDGNAYRRDQGLYVEVEAPVPGSRHWSGWVRAGAANGSVQSIDRYFGAGLVGEGLFRDRPNDRAGFAIARATISDAARASDNLPEAETAIEASYQFKLNRAFAVQPDAQYLMHPAALSGAPDTVVLGLRVILSIGGPKPAPATDASDTTVPADAPATKENGDTSAS